MSITTITSEEFNQNAGGARKAASQGPVFITVRGRPANVLLSIEEYRRVTGDNKKITDLLAMPGTEDIEFDVEPLPDFPQEADLS
jgi:prevent-host-death family protein